MPFSDEPTCPSGKTRGHHCEETVCRSPQQPHVASPSLSSFTFHTQTTNPVSQFCDRSYDTTLEYFINVSTPCSPSAHSAGVHLEVGVFASLCQYFSESDKQWRTDGMVPLAETNASTAVCRTTHLTAFAAGLFVPPNAVSFKIPVSITLYSVLAQNVTTLLLPHVLVFFFCLLGAIWCTKLGCVVGVCFGLIKLCRGSSYLA